MFMKEEYNQKNMKKEGGKRKEREGKGRGKNGKEGKKEERKKKRRSDSLDLAGSGLSYFEGGFLKS